MNLRLLVLLLLLSSNSWAQRTGYFDKTLSFNNEDRMVSAYIPTNYDAGQDYHLIIALHGLGDNSAHYVDEVVGRYGFDQYFSNTIVICPDGGDDPTGDFYLPAGDEDFIATCLKYATDSYSIDEENIVLQGFSLGGRSALKYGLDNPTLFSALLLNTPAVQGALDAQGKPGFSLGYQYENATDLPVYISLGSYDRFYLDAVALVYENLVKGNAKVELDILPMGHEIPQLSQMGLFAKFYSKQSTYERNLDIVLIEQINPVCADDFSINVLVRNTGSKDMNGFVLEYSTDAGSEDYKHTSTLKPFEHALVKISGIKSPEDKDVLVKVKEIDNGQTDPFEVDNERSATFSMMDTSKTSLNEGFEGEVFPPTNWTHVSSRYPNTWELDQVVNNGGDYSLYNFNTLYIFDNAGARDHLLTEPFAVDGNALDIQFDYAFNYHEFTQPYFANDIFFTDTLEVSVSFDCGQTFDVVYKKAGKELATFNKPILNPTDIEGGFTSPEKANWKTEKIEVNAKGNKEAIVRFTYISGLGGTINLDNVLIDDFVGVGEVKKASKVRVYPNPSKGLVTLQSAGSGLSSVQLFNAQGQLVLSKNWTTNAQEQNLDLNHLPKGVYYLRVGTIQGFSMQNIVLE